MPSESQEEDDVSQDWVVDSYRIRQELGFHEIVSREDAITRTVSWERSQGDAAHPYPIDYAAEDDAHQAYTDAA